MTRPTWTLSFSLGLTAGLMGAIVFAQWANLYASSLLEGWVTQLFWFAIGVLVTLLIEYYSIRRSILQSKKDEQRAGILRDELIRKLEDSERRGKEAESRRDELLFSAKATELYEQARIAIPTIKEVSERAGPKLFDVPLRSFEAKSRHEIVSLFELRKEEWERIRHLKKYFREFFRELGGEKFSKGQVDEILNRGASSFFYEVWALTVFFYFLCRDTHNNSPNRDEFLREIEPFLYCEKYLSDDAKVKKSSWGF